ncbi:hypothetical protein AWU65_24390 [Paenibacillus glucanolyticus]|uniref:Uncharacterized protein n=1 Tax=Paenibacillus glucanolyticus TaxID=59843 RepID=A0A163M8Y0_9BACL|nr:hypothetical protein [Paenibacillus glucanolyticus]KZS48850.1 hypothetical protein AWU65_24390 [Paenibacillus glucanolyticus]
MTLFYYIAASHELPTGSFGQKKTVMTINDYVTNVNPAAKDQRNMQILLEKYPKGEKLMEVYDSEEDAAGIFITGPITIQASHLFRHPFVYQVNPEGGSFKINEEIKQSHPISYQTSKKCLIELFEYLHRNMELGEDSELYSCWASGKERFLDAPKKELDLVIELSSFRLENEFEWKERQYIRIKK